MNLKRYRILLAAVASLALMGGCAPATQGGDSTREALARGNRNLITREEIASAGVNNLLEVVQRLRPQWLRQGAPNSLRGTGSAGLEVVVYQNNTPLGGIEALRQALPGMAASLRFLDGTTASNTLPGLGSRTVAGAIIIVTAPGAI